MRQKIAVLGLFVVGVLVSCNFLQAGPECKVESMLLTKDDLPAGTILGNVSSPIAEMPENSTGFTSSYGESAIYHEVARFPWISSAENEFESAKKRASIQTKYDGPWEIPPELSYTASSIFQKYYVACGKVSEKYQCRMIGQYDEYYVFFFAYISDNGITFEILNDLLQKIDEQMAQCLQE